MRDSARLQPANRGFRSALLAALLMATAFSGPAEAVSTQGIGSIDTECQRAGFSFGIEKWEMPGSTWVLDGADNPTYLITVTGTRMNASWSSTPPVAGVIVKAGTDSFGGGSGSAGAINIAPRDPEISHLTFCGAAWTPAPVTTSLAVGPCAFNQVSTSPVTALIDPAGGATIVVSKNGSPVHTFPTSGATYLAEPGTYTWVATAASGFALSGPPSGGFTASSCAPPDPTPVTTSLAVGPCAFNQVSTSPVTALITPSNGATIVLSKNGSPVHTFPSSGATYLAEPGAYTWAATAASGFVLSGTSSGGFTASSCAPPDPTPVTTSLAVGPCAFNQVSTSPVTASITPSNGATIVLSKNGSPVHTFPSSGATYLAEPGTYTWAATAASGFALSGPSSGGFNASGCAPSAGDPDAQVWMTVGACVFSTVSTTPVTATITPAGGASILLTRVSGGLSQTFTGTGGTASLSPGTYDWVATAASGFNLTGPTSGRFTTVACEVLGNTFTTTSSGGPKPTQVLGETFTRGAALPATGAAVGQSLWLALTCLVLGAWFSIVSRRRVLGYNPKHQAPREWRWHLGA